MPSSITFFSLISSLLYSSNKGINDAISLSADQPVSFVASKIDFQIRCAINKNETLEITPSNGQVTNLYGLSVESILNLQFKLKPKG